MFRARRTRHRTYVELTAMKVSRKANRWIFQRRAQDLFPPSNSQIAFGLAQITNRLAQNGIGSKPYHRRARDYHTVAHHRQKVLTLDATGLYWTQFQPKRRLIMWIYQYAYLKYALLVSRDYRCGDGHLIHDRTQ